MKVFLVAVAVLLALMASVPFWSAAASKRQLAQLQRAVEEISAEHGASYDALPAPLRVELRARPWKLRDCKALHFDYEANSLQLRCPNDDRVTAQFERCARNALAALLHLSVCDPPAKLTQLTVH